MKIFLAAPLFCVAERDFNYKIANELREKGFEVWLAQESPFFRQGTHKDKKKIYENNILVLKTSDVVVAVLDGMEVDAGVAYEIGYAKALSKPIIGLKTDYRTFSRMEKVNLMLEISIVKICKSIREIIDVLSKMR